jgi:undecaprenyl-diphosphatase
MEETPRMTEAKRSAMTRLTGGIDHLYMTIAALCAVACVLLTVAVVLHPGPFWFDTAIAVAIQSQDIQALNPFHQFVNALAGTVGVVIGLAVIAATFLVVRRATPLVAFSALYSMIYNGVNVVVQRPRPTGLAHTVHDLGGFSYPSGHVGMFVWIGVLVLLLARRLPRKVFWLASGVVLIVVLASAYSRVYVGAHWPTDVLGGLLVGAGWVAFSLSIGRLTEPVFGPRSAKHEADAGNGEEIAA